jgi:hypothetical protein
MITLITILTVKGQDINIFMDVSPDVPESAAMSKR